MNLGLSFDKLLVIGVIAAFLIGPDKLPELSRKLAQFIKSLKNMANGAQDRVKEEMGPEYSEVDWKKLDPRQYDPRRIVREALLDDTDPGAIAAAPLRPAAAGTGARPGPAAPSAEAQSRMLKIYAGESVAPAPFDSEAT